MNAWEKFRKWCGKNQNKPIRRVLGIAIVGSIYLISGSIWATFCGLALWLVLTR